MHCRDHGAIQVCSRLGVLRSHARLLASVRLDLPAFSHVRQRFKHRNEEDARLLAGPPPAKKAKTATPAATRGVRATAAEATLPIKREWFEKICYGRKRVEFREASPYWRSRLLGKRSLNVRLVNGRGADAPRCVYETTRVELLATSAIPEGLAPPPGTPEHAALFKGVETVIALHLGDRLELFDPKADRFERFDATREVRALPEAPRQPEPAAVSGPESSRHGVAGAPPRGRLCPTCRAGQHKWCRTVSHFREALSVSLSALRGAPYSEVSSRAQCTSRGSPRGDHLSSRSRTAHFLTGM